MEQEYLKDKAKFAQQHPQEAERIHLKFKVRALDTRPDSVCRKHSQPGDSSPEAPGSSVWLAPWRQTPPIALCELCPVTLDLGIDMTRLAGNAAGGFSGGIRKEAR